MQGGELMAKRRCISVDVFENDVFLDLDNSSKILYVYFILHSDDDGFVINPKTVMRLCGANKEDLTALIEQGYILMFDDGILIIKHWYKHNKVQPKKKTDTQYQTQLAQLTLNQSKEYVFIDFQQKDGKKTENIRPNLIQSNLIKDNSIKHKSSEDTISNDIVRQTETVRLDIQPVVDAWNSLSEESAIKPISKISYNSTRYKMLSARLKEYGIDDVLKAIENIRQSDFLKGNNDRGWIITFDWFVRPNNFPKVLEGNYCNSVGIASTQTTKQSEYKKFMADLAAIREECIRNGE